MSTNPPETPVAGPESFAAIFDANYEFVYRSVRRLGVSDTHAEDVVQEVFLVAHRKLAEFEGRSAIRTWLFGIARNMARSHLRRRDQRNPAEELPEQLPASDQASPREEAERQQGRAVLETFLESLDDSRREVFILHFLEQMTAPEIAEATDTKLATVYTRIRAARLDFQKMAARQQAMAGARDPMSELSPEELALLEELRAVHEPSVASKARVKQRIDAILAEPLADPETGSEAPPANDPRVPGHDGSPVASSSSAAALKWGAPLLLALLLGAGAVVLSQDEPPPAPPEAVEAAGQEPEPEPPPVAPKPPPMVAEPDPAPEPEAAASSPEPEVKPEPVKKAARIPKKRRPPRPAPAKAAAPDPAPEPEPAGDDGMAELRLLSQGQRALRTKEPARALELARRHAERYPKSTYTIERQTLEALALCDLGRTEEARTVAAAVLAVAPDSPSSRRLRQSCAK